MRRDTLSAAAALAEQARAEQDRWQMLCSVIEQGAAEYGRAVAVLQRIGGCQRPGQMRRMALDYLAQIGR